MVEKNKLNKNREASPEIQVIYPGNKKAVQFIGSQEEFKDFSVLKQKIEFRKRNELWLGPGKKIRRKVIFNHRKWEIGFLWIL